MIRIEGLAITAFAQQLRQVPTEVRKEIRPALRSAGELIAGGARSNASWSSRIPGAIKTTTSFGGGKRGGVQVKVDSNIAPHARAYEGITQDGRGAFRHQVFGQDVWVSEPTRPFLRPAVKEHEAAAVNQIQAAIDRALGRL